ncbi:MAG: hormogonium polysaccharide biosynthesis glycosyltransferase HpsE [Cyanobacteria bacterium P01_F01_bin.150]
MSLDFTVAIPVYNGADRIHRVIERLRSQINVEHLSWEILVIDNNSNDHLKETIHELQANWNHPAPLHYIFEPQQGLTFARACAVEIAKGKYVGFLDDDNLAHGTWLSSAHQFGENHPTVGAYGGKIHAELTAVPPPGWHGVKSFLAVRTLGNQPKSFNPRHLQLPPGAGLVIRKKAWLESVPKQVVRVSRGGDDYQISLYMHNQGWGIWYNPEMVIDHHIPEWRMSTEYIASQAYLYGSCTCELQMIIVPGWQRPLMWAKGCLGAIKRLGHHLWTYGYLGSQNEGALQPLSYNQNASLNMTVHCTRAFYWGNLISPWLYLHRASKHLWSSYFT